MGNSVEEKRVKIKHKLNYSTPTPAAKRRKRTPPKHQCGLTKAASSPSCRKIRATVRYHRRWWKA
jgi:hypothetical protein